MSQFSVAFLRVLCIDGTVAAGKPWGILDYWRVHSSVRATVRSTRRASSLGMFY